MKPDPVLESRRWFGQAEMDLAAARHLAAGGFHNLACFVSQQAVEKALKAYLYLRGAREVHGHSVSVLCADCAHFDSGFRDLTRKASPLDKYYIPTRYPNGLPGGLPSDAYDDSDSKKAIETALEALAFVEARLTAG